MRGGAGRSPPGERPAQDAVGHDRARGASMTVARNAANVNYTASAMRGAGAIVAGGSLAGDQDESA